jgi:hypothetical protein
MKKLLLTFFLAGIFTCSFAQTPAGPSYQSLAVKLAHGEIGSSARFKAMGGAQLSLGADLSSISGNPAGLGFYRSSDLSITPEYYNTNSKNNWFNSSNKRNDNQFGLASIGGVFSQTFFDYRGKEKDKGFINLNMGIGYHKTQNFNRSFQLNGTNPQSSMSQYFAESANADLDNNRYLPNLLDSVAYFHAFIMDFDTVINGTDTSLRFIPISNGGNQQLQNMNIGGSQGEWNFSFGTNYGHKLFLGASLAFTSSNYNYTSDFTELGIEDTTYGLNSFSIHQEYDLTGSGVHLKVGAIYRPTDFIRLGFTGQTATYTDISEQFITRFSADFETGEDYYQNRNITYLFNYGLTTPGKIAGGAAFFFGKKGLISADVEFINYSKTEFTSDLNNVFFSSINNDLITDLQNVMNVRLGAELNVNFIQLRGGFAYYPSPVKPGAIAVNRDKMIYSAGAGFNFERFYLDMGLQYRTTESLFAPYVLSEISTPSTLVSSSTINSFVTIGIRF